MEWGQKQLMEEIEAGEAGYSLWWADVRDVYFVLGLHYSLSVSQKRLTDGQ